MRARFWQFVSAAAFTCLVAPPALAHAVLINSVPSASQQLETAPQQIELRFNENVGAVFFKVLNRAGIQVGAPGEVRADGNNVVLPLGATLPKGTYVVTYRVISGDTHPVAGSYAFSIGEPLASATAAMPEAISIWAVPAAISRAMLYASALLVMGSALLLVVMPWPQRLRALLQRQGQLAARWAALALVAALGLGGADMVAAVPAALLSAQPWSAGVRSTLGLSTLLGMSGAMLAITAFRSAQKYLLLCSCGLLVVSFMVTGHAATAVPVWLAATSVGLHLAAAGFWVAALLPLLAYAGLVAPREAGRAMQQFSSHALWFVALLFASGSVISWIQVRTISGMLHTDYGVRLLLKLALVAAILGIAALNKFVLTPALQSDKLGAAQSIVRSIRFEALLMALVIAVAATLTMVRPPRALAEKATARAPTRPIASAGFRSTWTQGAYAVEIEVTPAQPGANMIMLRFTHATGAPAAMKSASIDLALPTANIEGISRDGQSVAPDRFHLMVSDLIIPGNWKLTINGFIDDFDKVAIEGTVPIN